MSEFSLALNEDQLTLQKWLHEFAVDVMRPNAEEWDEKEEFPWPIVQQAAEIGLYSWEFMAEMMMNDPNGISMVMAIEEIFWGDAGIGMAIMGSGLAAAGIAASGTPEQVMEWVPQCYGTPDKIATGAFAASEPDAGSDVNGYRLSAKYDEAKDEWVLNGTKAWITNGGMADIHVVVAVVDPEPGLVAHLVLDVGGLGHRPEAAIREQGELVVVVEHHAAVAGDPEVLQQHVAGEDVGGSQLLDGVAVLVQGIVQSLLVRRVDEQVQRSHQALCVEMADQNLVSRYLDAGGGQASEFIDELRVEPIDRKGEVLKLLGVGHAADPIVGLDHVVLVPDLLGGDVLLRCKRVLDDLEHRLQGGQREHRHHHAPCAGRDHELIVRAAEVIQKISVEDRFAVLVKPHGGVELGALLVGQKDLEDWLGQLCSWQQWRYRGPWQDKPHQPYQRSLEVQPTCWS